MMMVLIVSNRQALNRYTGLFAGSLVALYITFEAPVSGMSMNPARTVASALPAHVWSGAWLYFVAPVLGMLLAAEAYLLWRGQGSVLCCKLHHENQSRCIFRCRYHSCGAHA
jgi:aquaporin Z